MQASIHRIVQVCWSVWWSLKKLLRRFRPLRASQVLFFGAAVAPLQCLLSQHMVPVEHEPRFLIVSKSTGGT